jgi:hypothetical protein
MTQEHDREVWEADYQAMQARGERERTDGDGRVLLRDPDGSVVLKLSVKDQNILGAMIWLAKEDYYNLRNRFFPDYETNEPPITEEELSDGVYTFANIMRACGVDMG